jgi:hypothetical protein
MISACRSGSGFWRDACSPSQRVGSCEIGLRCRSSILARVTHLLTLATIRKNFEQVDAANDGYAIASPSSLVSTLAMKTLRIKILAIWTIVATGFVVAWTVMSSFPLLLALLVLALSRFVIPSPKVGTVIVWGGLLLPAIWVGLISSAASHLPVAPSAVHSILALITYILCLGPVIAIATAALSDSVTFGGFRHG